MNQAKNILKRYTVIRARALPPGGEYDMFDDLIAWMLEDPDPSLAFMVRRDILEEAPRALEPLRSQIGTRGWAFELLGRRNRDGHWGDGAYSPKWTCTHYALYELAQLEMPAGDARCAESAVLLLAYPRGRDGGVNYARTVVYSDVCINGMLLGIASRFQNPARGGTPALRGIVDYLLERRMADGGWNCAYFQGGTHSSLHTTIAALEGLWVFCAGPDDYRRSEIRAATAAGVEFILRHRLLRSERTGEVIRDEFFRYAFPVRWKYDILRCLDLFRQNGITYDARMDEALDRIEKAGRRDGYWHAASQPGKTYFVIEPNGAPGRWNTLRALRTLRFYGRSS